MNLLLFINFIIIIAHNISRISHKCHIEQNMLSAFEVLGDDNVTLDNVFNFHVIQKIMHDVAFSNLQSYSNRNMNAIKDAEYRIFCKFNHMNSFLSGIFMGGAYYFLTRYHLDNYNRIDRSTKSIHTYHQKFIMCYVGSSIGIILSCTFFDTFCFFGSTNEILNNLKSNILCVVLNTFSFCSSYICCKITFD